MALSFFSRLSVRAAATTPFPCGANHVGLSSTLAKNTTIATTATTTTTATWLDANAQINASSKAFLATKSKTQVGLPDSKLTSVVLLEEIPRGMKGEIIKVSRGYARNYLFPLGKAVRATPENIKQHSQEITVRIRFRRRCDSLSTNER